MYRHAIRKAGNTGLVVTTVVATGNLCHTLPVATSPRGPRTAIITKILAYNNTGANVTLQFGTWDRTVAGALFVAMLPILVAIDTFDNQWTEAELPPVEFASNTTVGANGRTGDIYVVASVANVIVVIEVKEK